MYSVIEIYSIWGPHFFNSDWNYKIAFIVKLQVFNGNLPFVGSRAQSALKVIDTYVTLCF